MYCSTRIAKHKVDEMLNILLRRRLAENNADENRGNLVRELAAKKKNIEKIDEQRKALQNKFNEVEKKIRLLIDSGFDVKDERQNREKIRKEMDRLEESRSIELKEIETLTRSLDDIENMSYEEIMKDALLRDRVMGDMVERITVYYLTAGHYMHIRLIGDDVLYGCYIKKQKLYPGENTQIEYITADAVEIDEEMKWLNLEMVYDEQNKVFRYVGSNEEVNVKKRTTIYDVFRKIDGIGVERLDVDYARNLYNEMANDQ